MKLFLTALIISFSTLVFMPTVALAQPEDVPPTGTIPAPTPQSTWDGKIVIEDNIEETNIGGIATKIIIWLLAVIALVATVIIIYAGILLVFNGGSEARVAQAKKTLTWAIVGLIVAIGAFAIVNIIQGVLK